MSDSRNFGTDPSNKRRGLKAFLHILKNWHGFKRTRYRRIEPVTIGVILIVMAVNRVISEINLNQE